MLDSYKYYVKVYVVGNKKKNQGKGVFCGRNFYNLSLTSFVLNLCLFPMSVTAIMLPYLVINGSLKQALNLWKCPPLFFIN